MEVPDARLGVDRVGVLPMMLMLMLLLVFLLGLLEVVRQLRVVVGGVPHDVGDAAGLVQAGFLLRVGRRYHIGYRRHPRFEERS